MRWIVSELRPYEIMHRQYYGCHLKCVDVKVKVCQPRSSESETDVSLGARHDVVPHVRALFCLLIVPLALMGPRVQGCLMDSKRSS